MSDTNYHTTKTLFAMSSEKSWDEFILLVKEFVNTKAIDDLNPVIYIKGSNKTEEEAITYFKKIVEHKTAVFEAGLELLSNYNMESGENQLFLYNLAIHDMSKFSWEEFDGYLNWDFKTRSGEVEGFEAAWVNHKRVNPHHPEYWFTVNRSGVSKVLAMPEVYVMEMVADWIGAGKTYGSGLDVWLPANLHTFVFHQDTAIILQKILNSLGFVTDHTDTGLKTI